MGKMNDYQSGRMDGLLLAQKIVQNDGPEALDKEIRFRGVTGVHTSLAVKELDKATENIKELILDMMLIMSLSVLHDEFDFGPKRCQRFFDRASKISESLVSDMASWQDYQKMVEEEIGIKINLI